MVPCLLFRFIFLPLLSVALTSFLPPQPLLAAVSVEEISQKNFNDSVGIGMGSPTKVEMEDISDEEDEDGNIKQKAKKKGKAKGQAKSSLPALPQIIVVRRVCDA